MRRWLLLGATVVLAAALAWSTLAWPGRAGVWGWAATTGVLRVAGDGPSVLPRWSYGRLEAQPELRATVQATSADEVPVAVAVGLRPPAGRLALLPAATPAEGLRAVVEEPVRRHLRTLATRCLLPGGGAGCPAAPAADLAAWLASTLRVPAGAVAVTLTPDAAAVGRSRLAALGTGPERPPRKLLVLGLDAVDWRLVEPFIAAGRMPNLARLRERGTWGEMQTLVPMLSPLIWTSMATGVGPDRHGILDFVERDPATGQMVPVSGRGRRLPAVWNIASAFGLEVGVVGWWATWPADRVNGVLISDRLYYTLDQGVSPSALRVDPPSMVYPAELTERVTAVRTRAQEETDWQVVRHFMDVPEEEYAAAVAGGKGMADPVDGFRRLLAATRTYFGVGLELAADQPDLLMVYIEGTDTIGHVLAPYEAPPVLPIAAADAAVYTAAIPRYFEAVDRWVGRYLERCPLEQWTVLVLSDHGFKWGSDRPKGVEASLGNVAPLWHADRAMFVLAGVGVEKRGRSSERPSVLAVAATVLTLLGLPPGRGWPDGVLPGCPAPRLEPLDYAALVPPESYRQVVEDAAAAVDPEAIAKLEALGYLSGGAAAPAPSAAPAAAATPVAAEPAPADGTVTRGHLNNLAVVKINAKQYAEAESLLRQAIEMAPGYAAPHYNLRRIYMEQGRYDDADRELWLAVDKGLREPEDSLNRAAGDYEALGMQERAERMLVRALERFPGHEPTYVHLMVARMRLDRCADGVRVGEEAVRRFPASAPAHGFYGLCAACVGDLATARRELARSLELNPDQPTLRQTLADLGR